MITQINPHFPVIPIQPLSPTSLVTLCYYPWCNYSVMKKQGGIFETTDSEENTPVYQYWRTVDASVW